MNRSRRRFRRIAFQATRWSLRLLFALAAFGVLATAYLRRDTTDEFLAAHARMAETRVERTWAMDASRVDELAFFDAGGARIERALVRTPRPPLAASPAADRRTLVVYAGKDTGEQILRLIPEWPDLTLVAPLYPDIEPDGAFDALLLPATLRRAVFTTVAAGMAALDHLDAEGPDLGRTITLAASLGTSFGTIHTALDARVDELVIVHGGGDFPTVLRHIEARKGRRLRAALLPWIAEALVDTYDPVRWIGRIEPRPLLMIETRRDRHFPVPTIQAVYDAASEPKQIVWTETEHVGAAKTEIVESIMAEVARYLGATVPVAGDVATVGSR